MSKNSYREHYLFTMTYVLSSIPLIPPGHYPTSSKEMQKPACTAGFVLLIVLICQTLLFEEDGFNRIFRFSCCCRWIRMEGTNRKKPNHTQL